eukprot:3205709-Amphidinium_carterae.1
MSTFTDNLVLLKSSPSTFTDTSEIKPLNQNRPRHLEHLLTLQDTLFALVLLAPCCLEHDILST